MTTYTHQFYATRHAATKYAADTVLRLVLPHVPPVTSAVDIGCGVGTWLSVLRATYGIAEIQGYDGPWVERALLEIPPTQFEPVVLSETIPTVMRRYDLAISLEVGEHLDMSQAHNFVTFLTALSDAVLFSAAIPGQGGSGHVNEQWPSYWAALFQLQGYHPLDCIRPMIWQDRKIPVWYRQNTLLFTKGIPSVFERQDYLDLVHPELYLSHEQPGVKGNVRRLMESVGRYARCRS